MAVLLVKLAAMDALRAGFRFVSHTHTGSTKTPKKNQHPFFPKHSNGEWD